MLCHPPGGNSSPLTEAAKLHKINPVAPGTDFAAPPVILAPHNGDYRQIPKKGTLPRDRQCHPGTPRAHSSRWHSEHLQRPKCVSPLKRDGGSPKPMNTQFINTPLGRASTPEMEESWKLLRDEEFSHAKPEDEGGRRLLVAHTAEPLSLCFTPSFSICSVFNQLISQGNQNICFMSEGSGWFWDGESRETSE